MASESEIALSKAVKEIERLRAVLEDVLNRLRKLTLYDMSRLFCDKDYGKATQEEKFRALFDMPAMVKNALEQRE